MVITDVPLYTIRYSIRPDCKRSSGCPWPVSMCSIPSSSTHYTHCYRRGRTANLVAPPPQHSPLVNINKQRMLCAECRHWLVNPLIVCKQAQGRTRLVSMIVVCVLLAGINMSNCTSSMNVGQSIGDRCYHRARAHTHAPSNAMTDMDE